ncbi:hypothetical protein BG015_002191 [Linnemannia schmuckeri]|uniref:F-box domain-containing protein n=1 Tax=Linnemannia schmuckeri TaxID=64567 RepID=A0A9P5V6B9_9FUNG|nr:hypothetical protein BG015_002191 [Linnemannia schmuckeri]
MAYDSPSPADTAELLAPSLCLNPDAIEDLAPVQPSEANLLPDSFPTLSWSEQSSADHRAAKAEKRLCYRHRPDLRSKRAADEIQLDQLQQDIKRLPHQDQQIISHIWSLFGSAPASHRQLVLSGLLTQCCVPQLSFLSNHLQPLLRIDFLSITPPEIAFRILSYLDATSLCHAAQVCKSWKRLADDDVVWHRMCEQHIGLKCTKCGWGLPLLEKKKVRSKRQLDQHQQQLQYQHQQQQQALQYHHHQQLAQSQQIQEVQAVAAVSPTNGHTADESVHEDHHDHHHNDHEQGHGHGHGRGAGSSRVETTPPHPSPPTSTASLSPTESTPSSGWPTRRRSAPNDNDNEEDVNRSQKRVRRDSRSPSPSSSSSSKSGAKRSAPLFQSPEPPVKPTELVTKRPWKEIYSERLIVERNWRKRNYRLKAFRGHTDGVMCLQFDDSFLITGSYDNTAKVWNIETGECLRTLTGHALCVRALHFDEAKLITGSMDRTLKIWNYHTGQCIRTLQGHTDGVVTLDFDSRILASGSADATIKIWNFATGECSTLKGHGDLVNKVQIYKKNLLVSASDDTTVKLWDIAARTCLRTFKGHVGRVQCLQTSGDALISIIADRIRKRPLESTQNNGSQQGTNGTLCSINRSGVVENAPPSPLQDVNSDTETRSMMPIIVTGGLDNTLKIWDADLGECLNTLFGHVEGVWSLAFDKLRIVSGSLDRTIKVWDTESGRCLYTLTGHDGPVTCVGLGDTRIVSGSDDGVVFVWDYGVHS